MFLNKVISTLKRNFLSGVLVVVPIILTYIVLKFLFEMIDDILRPIIERVLGYHILGLGVVLTLLLIILAGILTRNIIGARIYSVWEMFLVKVPIIRPIYSAAKQLLEAITIPSMKAFKKVVLIEYPRRGAYALGFLSNSIKLQSGDDIETRVSVFVPSTPTPVSGMVVLVPSAEVISLDMSVEDGVKFLVSGGVASPSLLQCTPITDATMESDGENNETR